LAPLGFGLLIEPLGKLVVVVSAGLCLAALLALMALHRSSVAARVEQPLDKTA
jgi:hypothetical protein